MVRFKFPKDGLVAVVVEVTLPRFRGHTIKL